MYTNTNYLILILWNFESMSMTSMSMIRIFLAMTSYFNGKFNRRRIITLSITLSNDCNVWLVMNLLCVGVFSLTTDTWKPHFLESSVDIFANCKLWTLKWRNVRNRYVTKSFTISTFIISQNGFKIMCSVIV